MCLRRLVTLLIAVGTLMIVPLRMPSGVGTLKGHEFGAESYITALCSPGGALVSDPAGNADLLSAWFNNKQSRDIVELPQTYHRRPVFCGTAFRAREVERYLLDLDPNGGVDLSGCFPMFFRRLLLFLP